MIPKKESDLDFCQVSFSWKLKNQKNYLNERSKMYSLTTFSSNCLLPLT